MQLILPHISDYRQQHPKPPCGQWSQRYIPIPNLMLKCYLLDLLQIFSLWWKESLFHGQGDDVHAFICFFAAFGVLCSWFCFFNVDVMLNAKENSSPLCYHHYHQQCLNHDHVPHHVTRIVGHGLLFVSSSHIFARHWWRIFSNRSGARDVRRVMCGVWCEARDV